MVWTEKDIISELENSSLFLQKKKTASDDRTSEIEGTLVRGIVSKFAHLKVDAGLAMKLHDCVQAASGFGDSSIAQLKKAIDDSLTQIPEAVTTSVTRPQWINCSKYLTKADWESLASEPYHSKVAIITKRLRLLGVQSMAEQSVKYATACLLTTYTQPPASDVIFAIVQDIKLSFSSSGINTIGLPTILKYPEDPNALDPLILAHAYKNGEVPSMLEPHQLPMLCKLVPLRKTHKQVATIMQTQSQQQVASNQLVQQNVSSSSTGLGGTDCGNFMAMAHAGMMQWMNMMKTMHGQQQGGEQKINLTMSPSKQPAQQQAMTVPASVTQTEAKKFEPKVRTQALALTDVEPKPVLPEHDSQQQDSQDPTQEEVQSKVQETSGAVIEEAAFAALKARNDNKKLNADNGNQQCQNTQKTKAKAKAKGQAKAKAKASATTQQAKGSGKQGVKKRPAASTTNNSSKNARLSLVNYEPGMPDSAIWAGRTRESWTSKHYHAARGKAIAAGYSDAEAKEIARLAHARAKCTWDEIFQC